MMKRITLLLTVITVIFAACFSFAGCKENSDDSIPGGGADGTASESSLIESGDKNAEIKYNIVLSATEMELDVGESKVLHASYGNKTLTFESSDNSVATVAADGTVTAKASGTAYITVSAEGKSKICKVTVVKTEWTVVIDGESAITAKAPFNKEFTAAIYKNGEKYYAVVDWTATGGAELTVDGNTVRIYIGGTGTYTLTATCKGVSASVAITVNN